MVTCHVIYAICKKLLLAIRNITVIFSHRDVMLCLILRQSNTLNTLDMASKIGP